MDGLREELELERLALVELEADALACYRRGQYSLWSEARREAREARAHIAALEASLGEGDHPGEVLAGRERASCGLGFTTESEKTP